MVVTAAHAPGATRRVEHVMGMPVVLDLAGAPVDEVVVDGAMAWLHQVDAVFSTYRPDSQISRLNRGELALSAAAPQVREVLERCAELREQTGGWFDARAGCRAGAVGDAALPVDPSGLVKGWAVDRAAAILERGGAHDFCLNAGGDIVARGRPAASEPWLVGVQHPLLHDQIAAVVALEDAALATSATNARGAHIRDPFTGRAPQGVLSVSITGADLATADALATAAFAMGPSAPQWAGTLADYEVLAILADEQVVRTPGFPLASG
jgi:thiamine biosynthesis lipoprotein